MKKTQTDSTGMPEYPKIETLFERDEGFAVNPDKLRLPVLGTIDSWDVTEKIDGTNIRVMLSAEGVVLIGGRTARAQLPADLFNTLVRDFPAEHMQEVLWRDGPVDAVLFGEGFGAGIQKGGDYCQEKTFALFDVLIGGEHWLDREAVLEISTKLICPIVPYIGRDTLTGIVKGVRDGFDSRIGTTKAEGIVARPIDTLFDRRGKRIIIKLKTKDFQVGR